MALMRLLGPNRALVLSLLDEPRTTSQLVALTGLGLGSVGGHLRRAPRRPPGDPSPGRPLGRLHPDPARRAGRRAVIAVNRGVSARDLTRPPTMVSREVRGLGVARVRRAGERMLGRRARARDAGRGAEPDPGPGVRRRARAVRGRAGAGARGGRDGHGHRLRPGPARAGRRGADRPVDARGRGGVLAARGVGAAAAEPGDAAAGRPAARDDLRLHPARRGVGGALLRRGRPGGGLGAAVPRRHRHGEGRGRDRGPGQPVAGR